jgi:hypothetical protein
LVLKIEEHSVLCFGHDKVYALIQFHWSLTILTLGVLIFIVDTII